MIITLDNNLLSLLFDLKKSNLPLISLDNLLFSFPDIKLFSPLILLITCVHLSLECFLKCIDLGILFCDKSSKVTVLNNVVDGYVNITLG